MRGLERMEHYEKLYGKMGAKRLEDFVLRVEKDLVLFAEGLHGIYIRLNETGRDVLADRYDRELVIMLHDYPKDSQRAYLSLPGLYGNWQQRRNNFWIYISTQPVFKILGWELPEKETTSRTDLLVSLEDIIKDADEFLPLLEDRKGHPDTILVEFALRDWIRLKREELETKK